MSRRRPGLAPMLALLLAAPLRADDMASAAHHFGPNALSNGGGNSASAGGSLLFTVGESAAGVGSAEGGQYRMGFANFLRLTPKEALADLIALIKAIISDLGVSGSLSSKLDNALKSLEKGNTNAATSQLGAFRSEVSAQSGKKIPAATAAALDGLAAQLIAMIGSYGSGGFGTASAAQVAFELGEHYCFPNPAKGVSPTLHLEAGSADEATVRLYDISGALLHEAELGSPEAVGGRLAFESRWDAAKLGSGVYVYAFTAKKEGYPDLKAIGKCAN